MGQYFSAGCAYMDSSVLMIVSWFFSLFTAKKQAVDHLKLTTLFTTSFKIVAFFRCKVPVVLKMQERIVLFGFFFLQPHSSIVTRSNFQPPRPKRGIIPLFCLSNAAPIDERRSHVLTHRTWKKFLAARSPRGSSPFGNVKEKNLGN